MIPNLINIGGQLQFRTPDEATCEPYWIEVDTLTTVEASLSWPERVERTAEVALKDYAELFVRFDFAAEGRRVLGLEFDELQLRNTPPNQVMCFVWYVEAQSEVEGAR